MRNWAEWDCQDEHRDDAKRCGQWSMALSIVMSVIVALAVLAVALIPLITIGCASTRAVNVSVAIAGSEPVTVTANLSETEATPWPIGEVAAGASAGRTADGVTTGTAHVAETKTTVGGAWTALMGLGGVVAGYLIGAGA